MIVLAVPVEGFTILNELTFKRIPKEGARVRLSGYYLRLEQEGAITIQGKEEPAPNPSPETDPEPTPKPAPKPTPPEPAPKPEPAPVPEDVEPKNRKNKEGANA